MDVKLLRNGELAVLDMGNRRVTTLSASGRALRTTPVRFNAHRLVPLTDTGLFAFAVDDSSTLWVAVNARGDSVRRTAAPPSLIAGRGIEREVFSAEGTDGAVLAFRWSDKLAVLNGDGSVRRVVDGVEPVPFPGTKAYPLKAGKFRGQVFRIDPAATPGSLSVAVRNDEIFVLFAGATPERGRIVDVYDANTGEYKGSHLLPLAAIEFVAAPDGSVATLHVEPLPAIKVWTLSAVVRK